MNIFCLTGHSHQKWPTNLCCMTERLSVLDFCFEASLCELLGDEYLISWLLLARMHVSGTAMHTTISPLSHTSLTYCPLRLPARPLPTHPVDGPTLSSAYIKIFIVRNRCLYTYHSRQKWLMYECKRVPQSIPVKYQFLVFNI